MKNSGDIRVGLIGYGKVAALHAKALAGVRNAALVSVCGHNDERRDAFAARWAVASRRTAEEMVGKDRVDAVIITTPHPRHRDDAVTAFEAGCHVLVEKPMAVSVRECTAMIEAAGCSGKVLSVVSQRRWLPACIRMREAVDAGKLGRPAAAQVTILGWRDEAYYRSDPWRGKLSTEGGGVLINQAPHQIDIMGWFMGPAAGIAGFTDNINHPYIEVEDTAVASLRFENGGTGSLLVSNSQKPGIYAKVHIHGTSGASVGVQTDTGAMFVAGQGGPGGGVPFNDIWTIPGEEHLPEKWKHDDEAFFRSIDPAVYFFERQIEDFTDAVISGRKPAVTGEDGLETVKIIETIYRSAVSD